MKLLVAFLSTCALTLGATLPRFDDKIVGGKATTIENHPYQVSLQYLGSHFCGGSIVNENTILTACHCVVGLKLNPRDLTISVGSTYNTDGDVYEITRIIEHPDYDKDVKHSNDVAILKLAKPLTFSNRVQPIALQPANTPVPEGTTALVTGWGTIIPGWPLYPDELHVVDVDVISNDRCENLYLNRGDISESMLCAQTIDHDSCQGDSGGPLAADGRLIGVVSWGKGCGHYLFPGVYAKVSVLRDFIDQHL